MKWNGWYGDITAYLKLQSLKLRCTTERWCNGIMSLQARCMPIRITSLILFPDLFLLVPLHVSNDD